MTPVGNTLPRYARIPYDVGIDARLTPPDIRVYFALSACVYQGTVARVGVRLIAESIRMSPRKVMEGLSALEKCGHIERAPVKRGQRAAYHLTSPVFGKKQRAGIEEVISSPSGGRRLASAGRAEQVIAEAS